MTDKEKLLGILGGFAVESIEEILNCFLNIYGDDISITEMHSLLNIFNSHLEYKITHLERARFVANERAVYIKQYLKGQMWPDEETAKLHLQPQIDNAQAIIDACNNS